MLDEPVEGEKMLPSLVTSDAEKILQKVQQPWRFISVGELHNSRCAIKFLIDHLDHLMNPFGGETYLFSEFLPANLDRELVREDLLQEGFVPGDVLANIWQRENGRMPFHKSGQNFTELYNLFLARGVRIFSIESPPPEIAQHEGESEEDFQFRKDIARAVSFNISAAEKINDVLGRSPDARVLLFTGMSHSRQIICKKDSGEAEVIEGIVERLGGHNGLSLYIHDPNLCADADILRNFECKTPYVTRYARSDNYVVVDTPGILFFSCATTYSKWESLQLEEGNYERVFWIGECADTATILDNAARRNNLMQANQMPEVEYEAADGNDEFNDNFGFANQAAFGDQGFFSMSTPLSALGVQQGEAEEYMDDDDYFESLGQEPAEQDRQDERVADAPDKDDESNKKPRLGRGPK